MVHQIQKQILQSYFSVITDLFFIDKPMRLWCLTLTPLRGTRVVLLRFISRWTAAFHARVRGSVPGLGGFKETKMFLPHPRVKVSIVGSLLDREVAARPQTARARISNPVSGGQCHLNHLTILRRFSWPSLAYMCTKVAYSPIHFISFHLLAGGVKVTGT